MNTKLLKYAIEVEKAGSITKAAESLYMSQPNLSKALRELESDFGLTIFNRTSKGIEPTAKGMRFLKSARKVLEQLENMETLFAPEDEAVKFDIAVPRASYISYAFTEFVKGIAPDKSIRLDYRETDTRSVIKNVAEYENNIGIIRYRVSDEYYYLNLLAERNILHSPVLEFEYLVMMSTQHPLAGGEKLRVQDLAQYIEISHGDLLTPSFSPEGAGEIEDKPRNEIFVYERASQFELLYRVPTTYMWVSPVPSVLMGHLSLVQKECYPNGNLYKDVLIYREGYRFSREEEEFIKILEKSGKMVLDEQNINI